MEIPILIVYGLALAVLFAYGMHGLLIVLRFVWLLPRDPPTPAIDKSQLPSVTIQLPLYNELHVAVRLVEAVCALDYPNGKLQVQVLDDSTDDTTELMRDLCAKMRECGHDVVHIHRSDRQGYKAGALRDGLASASGRYIAIFDADFMPAPDFLLRSIPHLEADPGLGLVQGRWDHINIDYSILTRIQAIALDAHFVMEQQVRNRANYFMNFNGTAGVWRRNCIEDAGNWESDTLTEDLDLSYRAQLRGWRFLYLNDLAVPAELPAEINGLKSQQYRWTKGAIETARKHLPTVLRSRLPLMVKFHAVAHLTSNLVFPCILVLALLNLPIVLVKQHHAELSLVFDLMGICVISSLSSIAFYLYAQRAIRADWVRRAFLIPVSLAGTMGLAVNNTRAVVEALLRYKTPFVRTPKYNIVKQNDTWRRSTYGAVAVRPEVILELLLACYFVVAIGVSIHYREFSLIPFQIMFLFGFGLTSVMSLRHAWQGKE